MKKKIDYINPKRSTQPTHSHSFFDILAILVSVLYVLNGSVLESQKIQIKIFSDL